MHKTLLVIDDSPAIHHLVQATLGSHFKVLSAYDGRVGLSAAATHRPDVILLDVEMPAVRGYQVCRQLKADRATRSIPVVFLTATSNVAGTIRGLQAGACDYIFKPFDGAELQARVRAALRTQAALDQVTENTMVDEMTGLFDRKYVEAQLDAGLATARRTGRPLGCILADIDGMHSVNGAFGRPTGDEVLCHVSEELRKTSRRGEMLCRFDGDEFVVLMPDASRTMLETLAERVLATVRSCRLYGEQRVIQVTASVGIAVSSRSDEYSVLTGAEEAMRRARQAGGDCIRFARRLPVPRVAA